METLRRLVNRVCQVIIGIVSICGLIVLCGFVDPPVREIEKRVEVQVSRTRPSLESLITTIPGLYGVPVEVVRVILDKESGGRMDAVRYEPGQVERARRVSKSSNPDQIRAYASSWCAMQIMGWWAPIHGLTWKDLLDDEVCIELGVKIFRECLDRHKALSKVDRLFKAYECYNGSQAYAHDAMDRLGKLLISRM